MKFVIARLLCYVQNCDLHCFQYFFLQYRYLDYQRIEPFQNGTQNNHFFHTVMGSYVKLKLSGNEDVGEFWIQKKVHVFRICIV